MHLNKSLSRFIASAAVVAAAAGASMAQDGFAFSTTFSPDPVNVNRPGQAAPEFTIDIIPGGNANALTPTVINLANFRLLDNPADPNSNGTFSFSQIISGTVTIDPDGATGPQTQAFEGRFFGSVTRSGGNTATINSLTFNMGEFPLFFDFGAGRTFTVSNPTYTPFGPVGAQTEGSLSATVTSTAVIPEPSEYAAMGIAGFALCGLMVRARRRKSAGTLAA